MWSIFLSPSTQASVMLDQFTTPHELQSLSTYLSALQSPKKFACPKEIDTWIDACRNMKKQKRRKKTTIFVRSGKENKVNVKSCVRSDTKVAMVHHVANETYLFFLFDYASPWFMDFVVKSGASIRVDTWKHLKAWKSFENISSWST